MEREFEYMIMLQSNLSSNKKHGEISTNIQNEIEKDSLVIRSYGLKLVGEIDVILASKE